MDLDLINIQMAQITKDFGKMMLKKDMVIKNLFLLPFKGIETWSDGSCYQGEYKRGKKNGFGIYRWADGSRYEGEWEENCLNGYV